MSHRQKIIGLMSGTSLDGVDAAVLDTDGESIFGFGPSLTISQYPDPAIEGAIAAALKWRFNGPAPNIFSKAEAAVHALHIRAIEKLYADNPALKGDVTLIGFHGQTILHRPATQTQKGATLQLGKGRVLAEKFGVPCVFDFRSADVAAGGQGAPLAPIYHQALCRYSALTGRIAVVNIGGVSNVTLIDGDAPLRASDSGPGNGPLDSWVRLKTKAAYDKGGKLSLAGAPDFSRIDNWLRAQFFARPMPRSADRYDFDVLADMRDMNLEDGAATLASFTAEAIACDLRAFNPSKIIVCGGGRLNPAMMNMLACHISGEVLTAEDVGWDGDALEAQAFAYLAARSRRGLPLSFPGTTGAPMDMGGGLLAPPKLRNHVR
ncbi:MAG: anhydro-N-acetylmuramic acid kinase [Robiginitomaculum sp.]